MARKRAVAAPAADMLAAVNAAEPIASAPKSIVVNPTDGYEPNEIYDVTLKGVVRVGGLKLLPRNEHHIKGSVLSRIASETPDVIGTVTKRG